MNEQTFTNILVSGNRRGLENRMDQNILVREESEEIKERFELAMERISLIEDEASVKEPYREYFARVSRFLMLVRRVAELAGRDRIKSLTLTEHKALNRSLYEDITGDNYQVSYANPAYACKYLGTKHGKLLSFLYAELRGLIICAYEQRWRELTVYLELFIEIYNLYEWEDEFTYRDVKRAIYDFMSDYCDLFVTSRTAQMIDTKLSFATDIIMEADLADSGYLYRFGDYISENELRTAQFLNSLPEDQVQAMADTFTEGYRLGFIINRKPLETKSIVNIRYQLGYERMIRKAILNFRKLGLEPVIFRAAYNAIHKRQHLKIGYHATSPNKQYDYDHRFDIGLFLDKALNEKRLLCRKTALESYRGITPNYGGPAVVEVFGEELFVPEDKKEAIKLDKRQQKLYVDYYNEENFILKEFYKLDETSFTIISYPVPEIGKDFEAIFADTVKVNTLDNELYRRIQQKLCDTLDLGEAVRIKGKGRNRTDMTVKLFPLRDREKETIFENCVADVNIPAGEVFTSPVLRGTQGVLHVPKVYLHDLEYRELELIFEDGKVVEYNCRNFEEESRSKSYIKENLLYNHDYLPLGEFAIGTNTTAYMMGKKYDIAPKLPILIAEKTGPHFAIGDTCYQMSEDLKVYNPDGKEIIARENEISCLRKTDPSKAYFNCHTDITLPYDEIEEISVCLKDGSVIPIILDSRFVLEGTQALNEAFDQV